MSTSLLPENRSDVSGFTLKDTLVHRYFYFRRNSSNLEVSDGGGGGGLGCEADGQQIILL